MVLVLPVLVIAYQGDICGTSTTRSGYSLSRRHLVVLVLPVLVIAYQGDI